MSIKTRRSVHGVITGAILFVGLLVFGATIWALASVHTQNRTEAVKLADDYARDGVAQMAQRCARRPSPEKENCIAEIIQSSRENQRNEYDLEAQRSMAAWTGFMFATAALGLVVSIAGIALVYVTFRETRRAALYAGHAARHSQRALNHMRKVSESQLRPWVSIRLIARRVCRLGAAINFDYDVVFRNHGQTVARGYRIHVKLIFPMPNQPLHEPTFKLWDSWNEPGEMGRAALMPGEEDIFQGWGGFAEKEMPWYTHEDGDRTIAALVVVSVFYRSEFDDQWHRTNRVFMIGRKTDKRIEDFLTASALDLDESSLVARPFSLSLAT